MHPFASAEADPSEQAIASTAANDPNLFTASTPF
jgi:hypothetical protein